MFGWELRGLSRGENIPLIETIPGQKEQFQFIYHSGFQHLQNLVASAKFRGLKGSISEKLEDCGYSIYSITLWGSLL